MDFKNTIIILTSNLGSQYLLDGIDDNGNISENAKEMVNNELRARFRPEFLNRLDETIMFKPLTRDNIAEIVKLIIKDLNERLADRQLSIKLSDAAMAKAADDGYDPVFGARPLKRYIQQTIETLAAKVILSGEVGNGDTLYIDIKDGGFDCSVIKS